MHRILPLQRIEPLGIALLAKDLKARPRFDLNGLRPRAEPDQNPGFPEDIASVGYGGCHVCVSSI
jgi:hypothetical protein